MLTKIIFMDLSNLTDEIIHRYEQYSNYSQIARELIEEYGITMSADALRKHVTSIVKYHNSDKEIIEENVKLAKQKQRFQDTNRVERKAFRQHARIENAVSAYNEELVKILRKEGLKIQDFNIDPKESDSILLAQLSDTHFNELIDLPNNKYDFEIAGERLWKYANEIISIGKWQNTNTLAIAFCGDLLNSDRRLDEIMSAATNRAKLIA